MGILKKGMILIPKGGGDQTVMVEAVYRMLPFQTYKIAVRNKSGQLSTNWSEEDLLTMYKPLNNDPDVARLLYSSR
jgi:hypothetical protein